jgi:glycosyltransferase involved in cell wall biosynthesis
MSENKGTYITCNTLIDLVKYENIIRFDSDDVMTHNMINEVARNIQDNDIMILGSLDLTNGVVGSKFLLTEGVIYFRKSMMDNIAGGYQPWICSADTELIKRVVNKVKITQLKKALFHRRLHSDSLTQKEGTRYKSELREGYKKLIKPYYKDNEIKIERVVNIYTEIKNIEYPKFKNPYKLTIIIPVYKKYDLLKKCLNSILTSTYDSFNLLIINDSPSEKISFINKYSEKFYKTFKYSEVIFINNNKNLGFIETVNIGINLV